jgi:hypothetical protein
MSASPEPRRDDSPTPPTPPPVEPGTVTEAGWPPPPRSSDAPARIGRFEIRRFLGEGSFGRVYEAYDPTLRRVVALKVARAEWTASPEQVERFSREARAAANLNHPNVVAAFDSGCDGGRHYIASAFVPGRALDRVLDERRLQTREAVEVVRKLAEALAYAHHEGVLHRDVKPGNVMLRDDGEPLLMDFGLAARQGEAALTATGQVMGTPQYCAPEQWRGAATAASDQYSLGCLLFELLTGRRPFAGADVAHYVTLHLTAPAPSPRQHAPGLPRDLENVTLKCLEKEQARRYSDCGALAEDLRRWLAGEPVTARRPGPVERAVRWARKYPAVAGLGVALLLAAVVATALAFQADGAARFARGETQKANEATRRAEEKEEEARREAGEKTRALMRESDLLQAERHRADVLAHAIRMRLALQEWERHDVRRAEATLDETPPEFRQTFEYRHVRELCRRKRMILRGHTGEVTAVAFSPDGSRIVSGAGERGERGPGEVKVWDARTGQELLSLKGHTKGVTAVAYSPDGSRIASASREYLGCVRQ